MTFDLGEARRKRDRKEKDLTITDADGEVVFKAALSPELPVASLDEATEGNIGAALRAMFLDPDDAQKFFDEFTPTVDDLQDLMENVYGSAMGEA